MTLLNDPRHSRADKARWSVTARAATATAGTLAFQRRLDEAARAIDEFGDVGYCGVSWGKDSMCVGHMVQARGLPLVWIHVRPIGSPECSRVAEASGWAYVEIERWCAWGDDKEWHASGTLESGFTEARKRFGARHVSGVRAEESAVRKLTAMRNGLVSTATARPLAWWTGLDVFAYAIKHDLPLHPAYGFTLDGLLDPCRLRVASLTGRRGTGHGREQWERRYYGRQLAEIARGPQ
jgi:phosphoadenosine phosphosulfate reductase